MESISLTDNEASKVSDASDVANESWVVSNPTPILEDKKVVGYKASVSTYKMGKLVDTGVQVYSGAVQDEHGNTSSNNAWMSESYSTEAAKITK